MTVAHAAPELPGFRHLHSGKVRDLYADADDRLLLVASDRISAYDHVLPTTIPDKGVVLNQLSLWWFDRLADLVPHHVVSTDVPAGGPWPGGAVRAPRRWCRSSAWPGATSAAQGSPTTSRPARSAAFRSRRAWSTGSRLPEPVFTPATKAPMGEHDENVPYERVVELPASRPRRALRGDARGLRACREDREGRAGIVLADTKLEFGTRADGTLVLADQVLTPDSSRFSPARPAGEPGHAQPSIRQAVRARLAHLARVGLGPYVGGSHRHRCRTTSWRRRARSTSTPTNGSPAPRWISGEPRFLALAQGNGTGVGRSGR